MSTYDDEDNATAVSQTDNQPYPAPVGQVHSPQRPFSGASPGKAGKTVTGPAPSVAPSTVASHTPWSNVQGAHPSKPGVTARPPGTGSPRHIIAIPGQGAASPSSPCLGPGPTQFASWGVCNGSGQGVLTQPGTANDWLLWLLFGGAVLYAVW
jgi:hypothetical protein